MPIPDFIVDLRAKIGHDLLWLPAVTAVVRREDELLLVQRADNHQWSPVTGVLDPGEEPAVGAVREILEETGVVARVDRLVAVSGDNFVTHVNGDLGVYLDVTFACTWLSGNAHVADDESLDVRWWPIAELPELRPALAERVHAALSAQEAARFRT